MKLTDLQASEIDALRHAKTPTRRDVSPGLEEILYQAIPVLDHGFIRVIDYMGLRVKQFVLQGSQLRVIQRELELQGAIGDAAPLAQEGDHLIHDRDKVHPVSSLPCAVPVYVCATPS